MPSSSVLSPNEQAQIRQWVAAHGTPQQVALRGRIVLAAAAGKSDVAIAEQLSINRRTVILWRKRFAEQRLDGLCEVTVLEFRKRDGKTSAIANGSALAARRFSATNSAGAQHRRM